MTRVYTLNEVAEQLKVKPSWIRTQCERRTIPFLMLAKSYRFTDEHIAAILATFEEKPAARRAPRRPQAPANITRLEPKTPPRLRKKRQQQA